MVVISVSLSGAELKQFDDASRKAGFSSRSDAVRNALGLFVAANRWSREDHEECRCVVSVVYADDKKHPVHEILHRHSDIVRSSLHTHLEDRCVEQMVVVGRGGRVKGMVEELSAQRDVRASVSLL